MNEEFYAENTESLGRIPENKFDLIFTPTAGYSGEVFAEKLDFDGDVIFYDYCSENLEIKQNIVNMNMSMKEMFDYKNILNASGFYMEFSHNIRNTSVQGKIIKERLKTFGTFEELRLLQEKMNDNYNVDYLLMDIIQADYEKLIQRIKNKKVFFDISNIYGCCKTSSWLHP